MLTRFLLLLTVIIWGSTFVATKILLAYFTPAELLGIRMLIGLPILGAVIAVKRISLQFDRKEWISLLLGSFVITAHFLIQITGLKTTTATNTGWIISVTPLALAVLSYVFLKEKIGRNVMIGIAVATVGIFLLISKGDFGSIGWLESPGDWLILISAHTWAIYTVITRTVSRNRNPLAVTFAILVPCGIAMISYLAINFQWHKLAELPPVPMGALLFLAVMGTALAHWFWQEGVAKIGAAKAGIFLYIEPLTSTALGVAYLHEPFGIFTGIGAALVIAGVVVAERRQRS
ncbi:MAG: DMT family transporter [Candidatus Zixiibacteriota bacterium]